MDIQYVGEHLFWGYAGRFSLFMAFFAAIFAAFAYYRASATTRIDYRQWRCWARRAFRIHSLMIGIASFALMFILLSGFYEYRYVWIHMENDLALGYKIASFWAGQEGSLLFWILCQVVFGLLLMRFNRQWEMHVMTIFSLSQVFMVSMLLGLRFGSVSIGLDPFLLLRLSPENIANHFFHNPEYLSLITDGNGLNPLLRNFWMLSHPPVTFIGYAAVLVPFAFALSGLWIGKFHDWIRPALPWTILGVFFLGAGILLGGVWAYESLTFGGFWAWDPIENASLVPWLILVAALHLMLISQKKRHSYAPAFLFSILAFVFVIYATYLTRSGVLSETSVHSFGSDGMGLHILIYMFSFLFMGLALLFKEFRRLPSKDSENMFTRDFWMFIGALVLVLSAFQIIFSTSIPVFNKFFGAELAPPTDVVNYYNNWQLPFAVVIALLLGFTHFLRWGRNEPRRFITRVSLSLILAIVFTILIAALYGISGIGYVSMLFASLFALFSSLDMMLRFPKQYISTGGAISHIGMALFLLAILLTFSKKTTISENTSGYFLGNGFPETENLLLIKGEVLPMGEFYVTYAGRRFDGERIIYQVDFLKTNKKGEYYKVFSSYPAVLLNERMGNVYEPFSKVFPFRDIFTYVTFADLSDEVTPEPYNLLDEISITVGDSITFNNNKLIFHAIETRDMEGSTGAEDVKIIAVMEMLTHFGEHFPVEPAFIYLGGNIFYEDHVINELDVKFRFRMPSDKPNTIQLEIYEENLEFIIIKTVIFPFINLLWISIVILLAGLWISYRSRRKVALKRRKP
ncbi:MAG: hypothetical protein EA394_09040 [Bacteroidia bacterium]|nr:MAG: hypothetical protein EA394_09040 [Bacteroidia bacterium]